MERKIEIEEIGPDILLIKDAFENDIIKDLLDFKSNFSDKYFLQEINKGNRFNSTSHDRFEIWKEKKLFEKFDNYWMNKFEDVFQEYYLKHWDIVNNDWSKAKAHNKTEWKDLFLYHYHKGSSLHNPPHCDFSGFTFILCLEDEHEGGEVIFPKHKFSYRLNKNEMMIFPGGYTHVHGLSKITNGERLILVGQSLPTKQEYKLGKAIDSYRYKDEKSIEAQHLFSKLKKKIWLFFNK